VWGGVAVWGVGRGMGWLGRGSVVVGTVRLVEMKAVASRLRSVHAADRGALNEWLEALANLDRASERYERARRAVERTRRRIPLSGADGSGVSTSRVYPIDRAARARLMRGGRANAAAGEARRISALEAGLQEVRDAKARLSAATSALRSQIPWAGAMIAMGTRGGTTSQSATGSIPR
jgi:hypothetical protein